jgi:hypothetical protein
VVTQVVTQHLASVIRKRYACDALLSKVHVHTVIRWPQLCDALCVCAQNVWGCAQAHMWCVVVVEVTLVVVAQSM